MKVYKILIITIIILLIILGIKVYNTNNKQEDSVEIVKAILYKANDIKNYECELNDGIIKTYKRYNNRLCLEHIQENIVKNISYMNYDTNTWYYCTQTGEKLYLQRETPTRYLPSSNKYIGICSEDINYLISRGMKIIKIKEVKYNDNECLKVTLEITQETPSYFLKDGEEIVETIKVNIWINMENGLIMKAQDIKTKKDIEYKYKFNTVTENDVTPNLSGYTKIKADF